MNGPSVSAVAADRGRRVRRLQREAGDDAAALLGDAVGQAHVALHDLLRQLGRRDALEDEDRVPGHQATRSVLKTPATQSLHARCAASASTPSAKRWCGDAGGPAPGVAAVDAQERVGGADAEERAGRRSRRRPRSGPGPRGVSRTGSPATGTAGSPSASLSRAKPPSADELGAVGAHVRGGAAREVAGVLAERSAGRTSCAAGRRRAGRRTRRPGPACGAWCAGASPLRAARGGSRAR